MPGDALAGLAVTFGKPLACEHAPRWAARDNAVNESVLWLVERLRSRSDNCRYVVRTFSSSPYAIEHVVESHGSWPSPTEAGQRVVRGCRSVSAVIRVCLLLVPDGRHLTDGAVAVGHFGYESWLERDHAMALDFDREVVAFAAQPFWLLFPIDGRRRSHTPAHDRPGGREWPTSMDHPNNPAVPPNMANSRSAPGPLANFSGNGHTS